MANVRNGNTWWVDTASSAGTATSYIGERNIKIVGVLLHVSGPTDTLTVYDKHPASAAVGAIKAVLEHDKATDTEIIDLSNMPIVCPNGIWVTLTGTPKATFILSVAGSGG